jgi:hypothetical protein
MGLTGVITEASFRLIPIETSLISVDTDRYGDLEGLMAAMVEADTRYRYSVAWVDSLHPAGRGVLTCGEHASLEQLRQQAPELAGDPLAYDPRALASAPPFLPGGLLNTWTVRAFNEAWFRKAPKHRVGELQAIGPYFHPLDGVGDWNRIYGPAGFLQYQFAVPDHAYRLVADTLAALRRIGAESETVLAVEQITAPRIGRRRAARAGGRTEVGPPRGSGSKPTARPPILQIGQHGVGMRIEEHSERSPCRIVGIVGVRDVDHRHDHAALVVGTGDGRDQAGLRDHRGCTGCGESDKKSPHGMKAQRRRLFAANHAAPDTPKASKAVVEGSGTTSKV